MPGRTVLGRSTRGGVAGQVRSSSIGARCLVPKVDDPPARIGRSLGPKAFLAALVTLATLACGEASARSPAADWRDTLRGSGCFMGQVGEVELLVSSPRRPAAGLRRSGSQSGKGRRFAPRDRPGHLVRLRGQRPRAGVEVVGASLLALTVLEVHGLLSSVSTRSPTNTRPTLPPTVTPFAPDLGPG